MSTEKLPSEFKEKWVKALRSGEYKQGRYYLHDDTNNSYCCLGVAEKICGYEPKRAARIPQDHELVPGLIRDQSSRAALDIIGALQSMNDKQEHQKTFPEIADWIEANL